MTENRPWDATGQGRGEWELLLMGMEVMKMLWNETVVMAVYLVSIPQSSELYTLKG